MVYFGGMKAKCEFVVPVTVDYHTIKENFQKLSFLNVHSEYMKVFYDRPRWPGSLFKYFLILRWSQRWLQIQDCVPPYPVVFDLPDPFNRVRVRRSPGQNDETQSNFC